ncbi:iron-sulfur cluster assembly scaffold protein [Microgenomates group bacterium RBG_19FT_COMBO_39_10]|nr:MAG: iron-sulfur cluster assembly scaffold protein [Microgenomates group bacterium RBG_19FT_COMBO_39_10]
MAGFDNLYPSLYSEKVMKHIRHPQNLGEIKNPDGMGTEGNPVCGDVMRLFIKVGKKKNKEYIKDIKFQTLGCGAAIASSSMLTTMVKGKTLAEAQKVTRQSIAQALGGLPPSKIHCSVLAAAALKKAIKDYQQKK